MTPAAKTTAKKAAKKTVAPKKTTAASVLRTAAHVVLEKNLDRTRAFTRIFFAGSTKPGPGQKRGPGKPSEEEKELLRAAVIFSIGALDAYLSEAAAEVLVAQLEAADTVPTTGARTLLKRVAREMDTLALELALTTDRDRRRAVARQALLDHLTSSVSNHGTKAVAATLERMGEARPGGVWDALDLSLSKWPHLATSGRKSAAILDHWTDNRHKVVHEGKAVAVNGDHARELIDFIAALCAEVDRVAVAALP